MHSQMHSQMHPIKQNLCANVVLVQFNNIVAHGQAGAYEQRESVRHDAHACPPLHHLNNRVWTD